MLAIRLAARSFVAFAASGLTLALTGLSAPAVAQEGMTLPPGMGQSQDGPDSRAQALQAELMQLDARLRSLQEGVLAKPEMKKKEDGLRDALIEAVQKIEPEAKKHESRLDELRNEIQAAQQSDPQRAQTLMQEGQTIVGKLQEAQRKAMEQPDIKKRIDAFEEELLSAMKKSDPEAKKMFDRRDELVQELQKLMGS